MSDVQETLSRTVSNGFEPIDPLEADVCQATDAERAPRCSEKQLARELAGMTKLHELSLRLTQQPDLNEVMREVMEAAAELLGAQRATAQLIDTHDQSLRLAATMGFDSAFSNRFQIVRADGSTSCAAALRRQTRIVIEDLAFNPEFAAFAEIAQPLGLRGVMSTPLVASDGSLIGVFTTYWDQPHRPSDHQMRLLDLYAQQAARQVERRVAEQALRASEQKLATEAADLESLRQLSLRVAATSDRTTALNDILDVAIRMVGAAKGNVQLYDSSDDTLKIIAHRGFNDEFLEYFKTVPMGYSCCGAAMENLERVLIEDVFTDARFSDLSGIYARHGFAAVQSTPLLTSDGTLLGMFSTHFAEPHRFSERDLRLLDQVAQHAGRIIERTQAVQALRDRQVWLNGQREALEAAVNGAPLETSLGVLVRTAIEAVGGDARAGFYLTNDDVTSLYHVVGMPAEYAKAVDGFKVGPDSLACGLATATGKAILTADVKDDPLWQPWLWMAEKFDYRACWSFPIQTAANRFVGTLAIYSSQPRSASPRDEELGALLAHTASIIISRHKESEVRKLAEEALREADRRKDEFLATLAHELRNPLAPIRSGLEVMRIADADPATREEIRCTMVRQTDQLVRLIDDLLDVSRITRGKLQLQLAEVELKAIVKSAVEATGPYIDERGHHLEIDLPQEPITLEADRHRLAQVLCNLLHNAAKYSPKPGHIRLLARKEDRDIVFSVRDEGLGIPHDKLTEVFQMFAQIERTGQNGYTGLGIGLTLVKSLVEMHGGTIEVFSEGENSGSEFIVRLPDCVVEGSVCDQPASGIGLPAAPAKRRVLVVDDNKDAARTLGIIVEMCGNDIRLAHDGSEALKVAEEFLPEVVLLDLGMPRMDGYEVAKHIRLSPWGQETLLVALTGWGQTDDKRRTKEAGFDHHLVKPADPTTLMALLAQQREVCCE